MFNQICECLSKCVGYSTSVNQSDTRVDRSNQNKTKADVRNNNSEDISSLNFTVNKSRPVIKFEDKSTAKKQNVNKAKNSVAKKDLRKENGNNVISIVPSKSIEKLPHKVVDSTSIEETFVNFVNQSLKVSHVGIDDIEAKIGDNTYGDINMIISHIEGMTVSRMMLSVSNSAFIDISCEDINILFYDMYFVGDFYRIKDYPVYLNYSDDDIVVELSKSNVSSENDEYSEIFFHKNLVNLFNANNENYDICFHFLVFSGNVVYYQSPNNVTYSEIFSFIDSKMKLFDNNSKIKIDAVSDDNMDWFAYSDSSDVNRVSYVLYLLSNPDERPKNFTLFDSIDKIICKINGAYIVFGGNKYSENLCIFHDSCVTNVLQLYDLFKNEHKLLSIRYALLGYKLFILVAPANSLDSKIAAIDNVNELNHMYCLRQRPTEDQVMAFIFGLREDFHGNCRDHRGIMSLSLSSRMLKEMIDGKSVAKKDRHHKVEKVGSKMNNSHKDIKEKLSFVMIPIMNRVNKDYCFILDFRDTN